jgi:hypothetical protein
MPGPAIAGVVASVGGGLLQAGAQRRAADQAVAAQTAGLNQQIAANEAAFTRASTLLRPYIGAGRTALGRQLALLGLGGTAGNPGGLPEIVRIPGRAAVNNGPNAGFNNVTSNPFGAVFGRPSSSAGTPDMFRVGDRTFNSMAEAQAYAKKNPIAAVPGISADQAQQDAINSIKTGSQFEELSRQGEYGILSNAAATGGLRGGNTQGALAQFRPAMLQQLIDKQLADLSGISTMGGNAASALGSAALGVGTSIGQSRFDQGAAGAAGAVARGTAASDLFGGITGSINDMLGRLKPVDAGTGVFGSKWGF